jgi:sialic acid synthase SpsE
MKADYEGYCKHKEFWDKHNVAYSLHDCVELAKKYNCPVPINIQVRFARFKILDRLAYLWRRAENYYLETQSGWQKDRLYKIQKALELNEEQTKYLEDLCYSMGI